MAEIIEIPVENNTSVSEYTPQQVVGGLGAIVGGFILSITCYSFSSIALYSISATFF